MSKLAPRNAARATAAGIEAVSSTRLSALPTVLSVWLSPVSRVSDKNDFILTKRAEGYSCSAIAAALVVAGLAEREVSRQAIHKQIVRLDPTLAAPVVSGLGCRRQTRRNEVTDG